MSAFFTTAYDGLVTSRHCLLHSVTVTPDAATVGDVTLYAGRGAETGEELLTVRTASGCTNQVGFAGLDCPRGLYVDVGSNVTRVTVEWEPVGYEKEQAA